MTKTTNTRGKKSNAKTNQFKDIVSNTKGKKTSKNQFVMKKSKRMVNQIKSTNEAIQNSCNLLYKNGEKLTESIKTTIKKKYQLFNCSVVLEDIMKTQVKYHGPVQKTNESLEHTKPNNNSCFEVQNQMENAENQFELKTNTPSKSKIKYKDENYNPKIKREELEEKQRTETTVKNSPNLPDKNEGRLPENGFPKGKTNKKTKRVSFKGISNGFVEKKTKSISKSHYLKNISNIIETKEKETCENQFVTKKSKRLINQIKSRNEDIIQNSSNLLYKNEEKLDESSKAKNQKNHQMLNCSVNLEDIVKTQVKDHGPVEKTSKTIDHTTPNKNSSFKVHNRHMKCAENQLESKTSLIDTTTKTTIKNKDENLNTKLKTEELEEKQRTETTVRHSLKLPNTNEGRLPEHGKFEVINAEQASMIDSSIVTTVKMRRRRPSIMIRAYYRDS